MVAVPTNVTLTYAVNTQGTPYVRVAWVGTPGAYTYQITRSGAYIADAGSAHASTDNANHYYDDINIVPGATYAYQVSENDKQYLTYPTTYSALSDAVPITIPALGDPSAPVPVQTPSGFALRGLNLSQGSTVIPAVRLQWVNDPSVTHYLLYRNGTLLTQVAPITDPSIYYNGFEDQTVDRTTVYTYSLAAQRIDNPMAATPLVQDSASTDVLTVGPIPEGFPNTDTIPTGPGLINNYVDLTQTGKRWIFTDVYQRGPAPYVYNWRINANDGGSPTFQKQVATLKTVGPNQFPLLQEGSPDAAGISFSGVILTRDQYEKMEIWFRKRILLLLTDDLGRYFYGIFSTWTPKRERRASNPWYHTYEASLTLTAYYNASGEHIYGRMLDVDVLPPVLRGL